MSDLLRPEAVVLSLQEAERHPVYLPPDLFQSALVRTQQRQSTTLPLLYR
jgi:hypothetical protein